MAITSFAAIDVGSNEVSIKIFEISKKYGTKELNHVRHRVELGSETYTNGYISNNMIEDVCKVLSGFVEIMKEYEVAAYSAYATSALREAKNSLTILDRIKLRSGLKVKIISNSEQRFLCYKAIALKESNFEKLIQEGAAIVDVSSGSTQISLFHKGNLSITQNVSQGSLRIKELLRNLEKQTDNYKRLLSEYIDCDITTFSNMYLQNEEIKNIIAVGDQLHEFMQFAKLQGKGDTLTKKEFEEVYAVLSSCSGIEISHALNSTPEQVAVLLPTAMIYHKVIDKLDAKQIWLCGINLCDGMAAEYMEKKEKIMTAHNFTDDILHGARNISKRYHSDSVHTRNVEYIALSVFDSIRKLHGLGKRERLLLQIAVLLHDCGSFINIQDVAENSYKIVLSTEIIGLSHKEREMIASLVRYNVNNFPEYVQMNHIFDREDYITIAKLIAIFRVANAMDKSRKQKFSDIKLSLKENELWITAQTLKDITLERGLFEEKADFFEQVYGIRPLIKQLRRNRNGK